MAAARGGSAKEKKDLSLIPFRAEAGAGRGRKGPTIERSQSDLAKVFAREQRVKTEQDKIPTAKATSKKGGFSESLFDPAR